MKIIIDTREQLPLKFKINKDIDEVEVKKLDYGDYACELKDGHIIPFFFERKSVTDLFGTFSDGKRYERFKKELKRAKENGHMLILVCEKPLAEVFKGYKWSIRGGKPLVKQLLTIQWRYGIMPLFFSNRTELKQYIELFYITYAKWYVDNKKGKIKEL